MKPTVLSCALLLLWASIFCPAAAETLNCKAGKRPLEEILAAPAKLHCQDMPVRRVVAQLASTHKFNVFFDPRWVVFGDAEHVVDLHLEHATVGTALRAALSRGGLAYYVRGEVVVVTCVDNAANQTAAVTYDVQDLLEKLERKDTYPASRPEDELLDAITSTVSPGEWNIVGGPCTTTYVGRMLVVGATAEVHDDVKRLLADLRTAYRLRGGKKNAAVAPTATDLHRRVSVSLDEITPLEFIGRIREMTGRDVLIGPRAVDLSIKRESASPDDPVGTSAPSTATQRKLALSPAGLETALVRHRLARIKVSLELKETSIRDVLDAFCREAKMGWAQEGDMLVLTSSEAARDRLRTQVYDLRDVMSLPPTAGQDASDAEFDLDLLLEVMMDSVTPDDWDDVGGPASLSVLDDMLIVSHYEAGHAALEELFQKLRAGDSGSQESPYQAVQRALRSPISIYVRDRPLADVLSDVCRERAFRYSINQKSLDAYGLSPDVPVTLRLTDVPLSTLLQLLLEPYGMTWIQRGRVLEIVALEDETTHLRTYEIADLTSPTSPSRLSAEKLLETIVDTVAVDSWADLGGPGSIHLFQGRLVVSQSSRVHEQIERLLSQMREVRAARAPKSPEVSP